MAFNVDLLVAEGEPAPLAGEFFLLKRGDITCKVHVAGQSKLKAKGVFYLSTQRIVFVSIPAHKYKFQSFEAPMKDIVNEKFNQPVFGANYLSGVVTGPRLPNPAKFSLTFNSGGVGTFLRLFFTMMEKYRMRNAAQEHAFVSSVQNGKFVRAQQAYFDPSDPSVVYVTQPSFVTAAARKRESGAAHSYHAVAATAATATREPPSASGSASTPVGVPVAAPVGVSETPAPSSATATPYAAYASANPTPSAPPGMTTVGVPVHPRRVDGKDVTL